MTNFVVGVIVGALLVVYFMQRREIGDLKSRLENLEKKQ